MSCIYKKRVKYSEKEAQQRHEQYHLNQSITKNIEKNQKKFLKSQLELAEVVKKDGKVTLEPKHKQPDQIQVKLRADTPFYFRVRIEDLPSSIVNPNSALIVLIKIDLKSFAEMKMEIRQRAQLKSNKAYVKHFPIPFQICLSSKDERPSEFSPEDCAMYKFSDSNSVSYKVDKNQKMLFVALTTKHKDCLMTA